MLISFPILSQNYRPRHSLFLDQYSIISLTLLKSFGVDLQSETYSFSDLKFSIVYYFRNLLRVIGEVVAIESLPRYFSVNWVEQAILEIDFAMNT